LKKNGKIKYFCFTKAEYKEGSGDHDEKRKKKEKIQIRHI
jgi:hypothetical protein